MSAPTTPAPPRGAYVLTPSELEDVLRETARMALEYWLVPRQDTEQGVARIAAEMLGRLEAERTP